MTLTGPRRGWRIASRLLIALAIGLTVALPLTPARAEGGLEVLQVGWDGAVVSGTWSPVRVRVTGLTASNARVEVVLKERHQFGPQAPTTEVAVGAYGRELALVAGVTKELTLWVPASAGMAGSVRLVAGDRLLAEAPVEFRGSNTPIWPLVGVLADSPMLSRTLEQIELPLQGLPAPLEVARLNPTDLPTSAERLGALGALVVQGGAPEGLTGEQKRAVRAWVEAGGHLVLAGGPEAARAAGVLPDGSIPVAFSGAEEAAELAELARWAEVAGPPPASGPVARFQAMSGSPLVGSPDMPLVWRLGLGRGTVTILAADPTLEPLVSWSGTPSVLRASLEPALPQAGDNEKLRYIKMEQQNTVGRLRGAVGLMPKEAYPDWRTVAFVLGGFALLVGPIAHVLLWRLDRRGLIWLAVPALAVLAAGALYYVGIGRGGRDVVGNAVAYVRLDPDGGAARRALSVGFYSPTRPSLEVTLSGDVPVQVFAGSTDPAYRSLGLASGSGAEPPYRVVAGRETRVEFGSGEWEQRTVALEETLAADVGGITANLTVVDGLIRGTVRNDTPYLVEDAAVVIGQSVARLGSLAPGQTTPVVLDPEPDNSSGNWYPLSLQIFGQGPAGAGASAPMPMAAPAIAVQPVRKPASPGGTATPNATATPGGPATPAPAATLPPSTPVGRTLSAAMPSMPQQLELPRDPEVRRRARLLDAMTNVPSFGPGAPTRPLALLGFVKGPVGGAGPSAGDHPVYHLTLVEAPLRLEFAAGPFQLPAALSPAEMLDQTSRGIGGGGSGTLTWVELSEGSITYGFRPPLPKGARAEALAITTRQIGSGGGAFPSKGSPGVPSFAIQPAERGAFSVYSWQSATWEALPAEEEVRVPASRYLGPDGLVKVQVASLSDQPIRFLVPELVVEGVAP